MTPMDGTPDNSVAGPWSVPGEGLEKHFGIKRKIASEAKPSYESTEPPKDRHLSKQEVENIRTYAENNPEMLSPEDVAALAKALLDEKKTNEQLADDMHKARMSEKKAKDALKKVDNQGEERVITWHWDTSPFYEVLTEPNRKKTTKNAKRTKKTRSKSASS